ncbi:MAG: argininosuccinate synthase [Planctomycetota bacterium]
MARVIFAFNGDLESRLALHWLVHERGHQVLTLSINLGQEVYLEPLGELALELGATAAQVIDRRRTFLKDFAFPVLQANAVYQSSCFLGSALARYVIAQEMVRLAHEEGCDIVGHAAASKGNDQVRMESAIAGLGPNLKVLAPVREWNLKNNEDKLKYARKRRLPIDEAKNSDVLIDRNLWGASLYFTSVTDTWHDVPADIHVLTRPVELTPNEPTFVTIGFEAGIPVSLNGNAMEPIPLVRELNRLGGENGVGRSDVVEDRLFGIKSREVYEAPAASLLIAAHRDLESLVQSKEMHQIRLPLSRKFSELVYMGQWFQDARRALSAFFQEAQRVVTGEVRLKLFKGSVSILGRKSPHGLYDNRLANQTNLELFDNQWAQGFTSLYSLPARLAARQRNEPPAPPKET